ncbi:MAG: MopE-related protein [bacterium]
MTPTVETCNNVDDDCDGFIDMFIDLTVTQDLATKDVGICTGEWRTCSAGVWAFKRVLPKSSEFCGNGLDDDCNGRENEGCPPMMAPETCNGIDDDLNGLVDDGPGADADCPAGEICEWGTCFVDCSVTMCAGASVCYRRLPLR